MKAQVSAEFLVVVSVLVLVFLIIYQIGIGQNINLLQTKDSVEAMRNAYALSAAINYVYLSGDGTTYNFTNTKEANETISISEYSVESFRGKAKVQAPILDANVNASEVGSGQKIIKNNNGAIEIG
jgi:uncharacterized protein (UPF0333 family)